MAGFCGTQLWFDAAVLQSAGGPPGGLIRRPRSTGALEAFASANGMDYDPALKGDLPSLLIGRNAVCRDVLGTRGDTKVEFGNHGSRLDVGGDSLAPGRMGYIAVRHGREVPHILVSFGGGLGRSPALKAANLALSVLSAFDESASGNSETSAWSDFRAAGVAVRRAADAGFTAIAAAGAEGAADELLTPAVGEVLRAMAESFTVEIRSGWMLAYSHYGDISTKDPQIWAWAFSVASRMLDVAQVWRESWPASPGEYDAGAIDPRTLPLYTPTLLPRPERTDGAFTTPGLNRGR